MITRRDFKTGAAAIATFATGARTAAAQDRTGVTDGALKIGVLGSLTGVQAVFGQGNLSGAQIVLDEQPDRHRLHRAALAHASSRTGRP
jgi:branched-chain amino acid transport system substrate-binding protein